jgi:hypothetical protein
MPSIARAVADARALHAMTPRVTLRGGASPVASGRARVVGRIAWLIATAAPASALAVVDGEIDPNALASPYAGVGSVRAGTGSYSGVLVAPDFVLTAAHVVGRKSPAELEFQLNLGGDAPVRLAADAVFVRPGYGSGSGPKLGTGDHDLALIRLEQAAPAGVPIYPLFGADLPQGALITFVGHGRGGTGAAGATEPGRADVKRVGRNVAECFALTLAADNCGVAAFTGSGPRSMYLFRFDGPDAPPSAGRLPWGEATLATGDSGSPAFVEVGGRLHVAGVNTFVTLQGTHPPPSLWGTWAGGVLLSGANGEWVRGVIASSPTGLGVAPPPTLFPSMADAAPAQPSLSGRPDGVRGTLATTLLMALAIGCGIALHLWRRAARR